MTPILPILIVSFLIGALLLALRRVRTLENELEQWRELQAQADKSASQMLQNFGPPWQELDNMSCTRLRDNISKADKEHK